MVSVIIVNYNTKELTFECIKSIYHQTKDVEFQIILVDNDSSDDSVDYLRKSFPLIDIIKSPINLGFGKANNLGAKIAKGDFLFLLNSDTKLIENSILKLQKFFIENQTALNLGVVGCKLIDANFQLEHYGGDFPSLNKSIQIKMRNALLSIPMHIVKKIFPTFFLKILEKRKKKFRSKYNQNISFFEIDYVIGANLFMKSSLFNRLEGFSNDFFMYYEETDLQKRISNLGFSRIIYTGTKLIHYGGESGLGKRKNLQRIINNQSLLTYFKKNEQKNYIFFVFIECICTFFSFLDFNYSLKENLIYQKHMILFLFKNRIYGMYS